MHSPLRRSDLAVTDPVACVHACVAQVLESRGPHLQAMGPRGDNDAIRSQSLHTVRLLSRNYGL